MTRGGDAVHPIVQQRLNTNRSSSVAYLLAETAQGATNPHFCSTAWPASDST